MRLEILLCCALALSTPALGQREPERSGLSERSSQSVVGELRPAGPIAAILMLSSVVLIGYLGQLNLAALTFAGVAAYLATRFAADGTRYGVSPLVLDGPGLPDPIAVVLRI